MKRQDVLEALRAYVPPRHYFILRDYSTPFLKGVLTFCKEGGDFEEIVQIYRNMNPMKIVCGIDWAVGSGDKHVIRILPVRHE